MTKKILFTGGGTAGHVTLNLALIPWFIQHGWQIDYIGSKNGMERDLIAKIPEVTYYSVPTGKLRRYFSWQNLWDMVKIPLGCFKATWLVHHLNPDIVFSKGGFVSFPVVVGGFLNRKQIFMHESDITPGLANKLSLPFVSTFFTTFPETVNAVKPSYRHKVKCVGPVLSPALFTGTKEEGARLTGFTTDKPTVMFIGGSLGAKSLNDAVAQNLKALTENYQIIHVSGKNGYNPELQSKNYVQYAYAGAELKDLLALSDIVVSRAGSNSIFELACLHKAMILVPLPSTSSRGEQRLNAESLSNKGLASIIADEDIANPQQLLPELAKLLSEKATLEKRFSTTEIKTTTVEDLCNIVTEKQK
jgi:UDP-N-acetylglucosamine--N-acetylmuramyl-(pentapeptide) pyrophosphoryl-undecaprenol N-acetylglucosamine transferase